MDCVGAGDSPAPFYSVSLVEERPFRAALATSERWPSGPGISGSAFYTVKSTPFTLVLKV